MVLSYPMFFTLYAASMVTAVVLGLLVLVRWKNMFLRKTMLSVRYNIVYVIMLVAFPLVIEAQDIIERHFAGPVLTREVAYTNWIFSLLGGVIQILQERLNYAVLTDFFIIVYAWLFAFLIYFAPLLLLVRDDRLTLRKYAIAITFNYLILIPFYAFFPVSVSSSYSDSGMIPLLYASPHWGRMVTSISALNNDFPSGHVSISVTTFLVFATAGVDYRKFSYFLGAGAIAIVVSVLYLGIHWPADVFVGFLVGIGTTMAARMDRIQMTVDRWVRSLSRKILRHDKQQEVAPRSSGPS